MGGQAVNALALLSRLRELGIEVQAEGGQLRLRGRRAALSPELRQGAVAHKEALLSLLRAPAAEPICPSCRRTDYMPLGSGWRRCWACGQRWGPPAAPDPGNPPDLELLRDRLGTTDRRKR
jgi:TubC N-terminal docking domain